MVGARVLLAATCRIDVSVDYWPHSTSTHPQQWCDRRERATELDINWINIGEFEKLDVLVEALEYWESVRKLVVTSNRFTVGSGTGDGGLDARTCDVLEDASFLPTRIARSEAGGAKLCCLLRRYLVVGNENRLTATRSDGSIASQHALLCRAPKIKHHRVRPISNTDP